MNILQNIWAKFQRVMEAVLEVLEQGTDYVSFEEKLKEELNELGRGIIKEVLEAGDAYLRGHKEERRGWAVERREEEKTILTCFGQVTYRRTYYRHEQSGEYAHLVDRMAGYGPHARLDASLKAEVIDLATEISYRKSGKEPGRRAREAEVSATAVMQAIRSFTVRQQRPACPAEKRRVAVLYVEADEDHVAGQKGETYLPRLVYIHEGKEKVGRGRQRLKRPHYLAGIWRDSEELLLEVLDYIDGHYDLEHLERIFIGGDGDGWIRKGLSILPRSVFVLDRFHLDKYLVAALGRDTQARHQAWAAIRAANRPEVEKVLKQAAQRANSPNQEKAAKECLRYVRRNWDGIKAYRLYREARLGVSAEGHVSHVLAARLSSRPLAWSRAGVDQMARLRAMKANGLSVRDHYLDQVRQKLNPFKVERSALAAERQKLARAAGEVLDNLPALRGPVTQLRRALKEISRGLPFL